MTIGINMLTHYRTPLSRYSVVLGSLIAEVQYANLGKIHTRPSNRGECNLGLQKTLLASARIECADRNLTNECADRNLTNELLTE